MKKITHIFVVIPFFNEAETLLDTCLSLGFATDKPLGETINLILVNNNSDDESEYIATEFKDKFKNQSIYIFSQQVQGIVPTRAAGNQYVRKICFEREIPESLALIIQADADTIYSPNYIDTMRMEADLAGPNVLVEAETRYPEIFVSENSAFLNACLEIDQACEKYFCEEQNDLIVDDKAVAYRLEDYFKWGGHQIVYNHSGDELLAETTRLYIKAKTFGTSRFKTSYAYVIHSVRNIQSKPALVFATAGYPREAGWIREFYKKNNDPHLDHYDTDFIKNLRTLHLLGLFTMLPAHFLNTCGLHTEKNVIVDVAIEYLPKRNIQEIRDEKIHLLIEDVFRLMDDKKEDLLKLIHNK